MVASCCPTPEVFVQHLWICIYHSISYRCETMYGMDSLSESHTNGPYIQASISIVPIFKNIGKNSIYFFTTIKLVPLLNGRTINQSQPTIQLPNTFDFRAPTVFTLLLLVNLDNFSLPGEVQEDKEIQIWRQNLRCDKTCRVMF